MQQAAAVITLVLFIALAAYSLGYRIIFLDDFDYLTQLQISGKL